MASTNSLPHFGVVHYNKIAATVRETLAELKTAAIDSGNPESYEGDEAVIYIFVAKLCQRFLKDNEHFNVINFLFLCELQKYANDLKAELEGSIDN